jgi:aldehyde dehydrogenase (NAD+)
MTEQSVLSPPNGAASPPTRLMLIGGNWVEAAEGEWREITSPGRRGHVLARVPRAGATDVDRAVAAGREAFPDWRDQHFTARQRLLLRIADAIEARVEELAQVTAVDTGNALRTQARPEAALLVDLFRYFGGVAGEVKGTTLPAGASQLQYTRQEPLGVVGAILPWNSPLMIAGFKVPAALAAGNTIVLKAAEDAPLSILLMAEICQDFLPPGVLNVVTGTGRDAGAALVDHPGVDKISFTGSTEVGRGIAGRAGERLAHVSLELGGKNPSIVFPGAVSDELIDGLVASSRITRQGQSCTAGSRLYLHRDVHDEVLARLAERLGALRVGDPLDEASDIGAVINQTQFDSIRDYLEDGLAHLRVELGGCPRPPARSPTGSSTCPRCSPAATTASASPGRRSSAPWSSPFPGPTSTTSSGWPTTPPTGWRPTSGARTSTRRSPPRTAWKPAGCRSTRAADRSSASPTAATSRAV